LKFLRKIKYDYRYGLFDLFRRRDAHVLTPYTPTDLTQLTPCDGISQDSLVMVSASYPVSEECAENLCPLEENHAISHMAVENLKALFAASESACGEKILFTSTYRTLAFQSSIYGVNPYAAKPGESEHHSGLVADIKVDGYAQRRFIMSKTGKWMAKHAHEYGFVIRYPLWGEKRTGVDYEPWHLRYVGAPHAEIMYRSKLVLEDYLAMLEKGDFFRYGDYVITAQKGSEISFPREAEEIYISQNTKGGYVLWGNV
jgi:D-alanyl-D-alanine carboxypeptidase